MIAFEFIFNGQRIATAGVGEWGMLLGILRWVRRRSDHCTFHAETFCEVEIYGHSFTTDDHLVWAVQPLTAGDEVLVRIIETEQVDEPTWKTPGRDFPFAGNDQRDS